MLTSLLKVNFHKVIVVATIIASSLLSHTAWSQTTVICGTGASPHPTLSGFCCSGAACVGGGGGSDVEIPPDNVGFWECSPGLWCSGKLPDFSPAPVNPDFDIGVERSLDQVLNDKQFVDTLSGNEIEYHFQDIDVGFENGVRSFKETSVVFENTELLTALKSSGLSINDFSQASNTIFKTLQYNRNTLVSGVALQVGGGLFIYQRGKRVYLLNKQAYLGLLNGTPLEASPQAAAISIAAYDQSNALKLLQRERLDQSIIDKKIGHKLQAKHDGTAGLSPEEFERVFTRLGKLDLRIEDIPLSERAAVVRNLAQEPEFAQKMWEGLPPSFRDSLNKTSAISEEVASGKITPIEGYIHGMAEVGGFLDGMVATVVSAGVKPYADKALEITPDQWEAIASDKLTQGKENLSAFGWVTLAQVLHPGEGLAGVAKAKQDIAKIQQGAAEWARLHPRQARLLSSSIQVIATSTAIAGGVGSVTKLKLKMGSGTRKIRKDTREEIDAVYAQGQLTAKVARRLENDGFPPVAAKQTAEILEEKGWLKRFESKIADSQVVEKRGHTIRDHVGMTDSKLRRRFIEKPYIKGASTYNTLEDAENAISKVIRENQREIQDWLSNPDHPIFGRPKAFDMKNASQIPTGKTILGPKSAMIDTYGARVVLQPDGSGGYIIKTSFPKVTP